MPAQFTLGGRAASGDLGLITPFTRCQNCGYAILQRRSEIFLFEPKQAHGQPSQVIPLATDRQFAGSPERVGGLSPKVRDLYIRWAAFHNSPPLGLGNDQINP